MLDPANARDVMALFGIVWLLRVRSETRGCPRCSKRRDRDKQRAETILRADTAVEPPPVVEVQPPPSAVLPIHHNVPVVVVNTVSARVQQEDTNIRTHANVGAPTGYCEVHGYRTRPRGEFLVVLEK